MTKEELAKKLDGRHYSKEITKKEIKEAEENGLVVVFGYSDDNAEFRGAINAELDCYEGSEFLVTPIGVFREDHDCYCGFCGFKEIRLRASRIKAIWAKDDYDWEYETSIPHATFDIIEDGNKYCKGIVFSMKDIESIL